LGVCATTLRLLTPSHRSATRCVLIGAWLVAPVVNAASDEPEIGIADEMHQQVSQRLSDFVGQIDGFFGDDLKLEQANESWARVRIDGVALENESPEVRASIKFKLVLPSTENRFRLLLSTEDEDIGDLDAPPVSSTMPNRDSGNVSLALRFLRNIRQDSGVRFDMGARIRDGEGQIFGRIGAFIRRPVDNNWEATLSNNAIYYSRSGFEDTLTLKLERFIGRENKQVVLATTQFTWREGNSGAGITEKLGWYRELSDKASVAVEFQVNVLTAPESGQKRLRSGKLSFRLRQNIWRPWFFYELEPSISWPADEQFAGLYGGLIRVEVNFGRVN